MNYVVCKFTGKVLAGLWPENSHLPHIEGVIHSPLNHHSDHSIINSYRPDMAYQPSNTRIAYLAPLLFPMTY